MGATPVLGLGTEILRGFICFTLILFQQGFVAKAKINEQRMSTGHRLHADAAIYGHRGIQLHKFKIRQ